MAEKKSIKVTVVGKELMIKGYETEEYMVRVASYINNMRDNYEKIGDFHHTSNDNKYRMLMLNLADDFFKEKQHAEELDSNLKDKINELDEMKHELVNKEVMLDNLRKELEQAQKDNREQEKQLFELQTTMKSMQKELDRYEEAAASGPNGSGDHGKVIDMKGKTRH